MKKLPLTAIIQLCFFACATAQNLPEKDKPQALAPDILTTLVSVGKAPAPKATGGKMPITPLIRVFNNYTASPLSNVRLEWELLVNGTPGAKGAIVNLFIAARQSKEIRLPAKIPTGPGEEVFLNIRYLLKKQEALHPAGFVVAEKQLLLKKAKMEELTVKPAGELTFRDEDGLFTVNSPLSNAAFQFSKQTGWLQSCVLKGAAILDDTPGLKPDIPAEPRLQLFSTSTSSELVIVRSDYTLPEVTCMLHVHYTINAKGEMLVDQVMEADSTSNGTNKDTTGSAAAGSLGKDGPAGKVPLLPRFGMLWILPAGYDSIAYYGPGPQGRETGGDDSAEIGIYGQRVQATGNRTSVRWWKVMDHQGKGLLITADSSLLNISTLQPAGEGRPGTRLYIDYRPMDSGGGITENYHLTYKCSFIP